jgi:hypothetical protein
MQYKLLPILAILSIQTLPAQLTPEQRIHDFQNLAALYAKRYAPLEWKKLASGFDARSLSPWLDRVRRAANDIEYHEIAAEYVAGLADTHSWYRAPGGFSASLGFSVDIYDGVVLIDQINRMRLPESEFPFQVGDELVSVDGRTSEEWIAEFSKRRRMGNPVATRRAAADRITFRTQAVEPRAAELGDTASVMVRNAAGQTNTYVLRWEKTNLPFAGAPVVPSVRTSSFGESALTPDQDYMQLINSMWNWSAPSDDPLFMGDTYDSSGNIAPRKYLLGYGARDPVFKVPENFVQRLGRTPADFHFSGTYESDGLRIGYLRIPNFAPFSLFGAIREIESEIEYFEANTDGLIIDVSRNTGGGCYMLDAAKRLINHDFWFFGEEIRPTWDRITAMQFALETARRFGAEEWVINMLDHIVGRMRDAYASGRNLTDPIPACAAFMDGAPVWDHRPAAITYSKPMIMLVDEFSTSAGDIFPAMIQDNRRALLVGARTNGAGGSVSIWPSGFYSEGVTSNTNTLVVRRETVANAPDMPVSRYIEGTGVRPDVELNRMTKENLLNQGKPYVDEFTRIMVQHIRGER